MNKLKLANIFLLILFAYGSISALLDCVDMYKKYGSEYSTSTIIENTVVKTETKSTFALLVTSILLAILTVVAFKNMNLQMSPQIELIPLSHESEIKFLKQQPKSWYIEHVPELNAMIVCMDDYIVSFPLPGGKIDGSS